MVGTDNIVYVYTVQVRTQKSVGVIRCEMDISYYFTPIQGVQDVCVFNFQIW